MQNLDLLKTLISEYSSMLPGELIIQYLEVIPVCSFQGKKVGIKRKALKHFVESRKKELISHFNGNEFEILNLLFVAISKVGEIFLNHGAISNGDHDRKIISKDYSGEGLPNLRIVFEDVGENIEIVSIHFRKLRK